MNKITKFFIHLTILLLILELSCYGLYYTNSPLYLVAIFIATIGITLAGYGLYRKDSNSSYLKRNEYHFYYIDSNPSTDEFFNTFRKRL